MPDRLLILRLAGELYTKSRATRLRFAKRLAANVADALDTHGIAHRLERTWSRFYLETEAAEAAAAAEVLSRVFGLQSISEVERRSWERLEDVVTAGEAFFRDDVRGRRFAVRASRRGNRGAIPFDSTDVERALGRALLPHAARVDLGDPEVVAHVEVEPGATHLFRDRVRGHGGLPVGVEGRGIALVSGGFDSAVAAWLMLKRGVHLDYVFCNLGGATHRRGALEVMAVLARRWSYGSRPRLFEVDLRPLVEEIQEKVEPRLWQVILKRRMLRAAEAAARKTGAVAVVTGDAVGQVSSQTLQNLAVVSHGARLPVLRPLVGFNKEEILALARAIGVYDLAAVVAEYCGLAPRHPATKAGLGRALAADARLDEEVFSLALTTRRIWDLRGLDLGSLPAEEAEVEAVPPGATVLDVRSRAAFDAWHWPGALHLDFPRALAAHRSFARDRAYVVYCEVGLKSAHLAERMRAEGLDAASFKGGLKGLMGLAEREGALDPGLLAPALRE